MTERVVLLLTCLVPLSLGIIHIVCYKKLARKYTERFRNSFFSRLIGFEYTESSYRVQNIAVGIAAVAISLLGINGALSGKPGGEISGLERILFIIMVGVALGAISVAIVASVIGRKKRTKQ